MDKLDWIVDRNLAFCEVLQEEDIPAVGYLRCNLAQKPIDFGGVLSGRDLWPSGQGPLTFDGCNLDNVSIPPGSTVIGQQPRIHALAEEAG